MGRVMIKHRGKDYFQRLGSAERPHAGYTSLRNMQATLLWRWRRTKRHDPKWMTTPSRAYRTEKGVEIFTWSTARDEWVLYAEIIWED